MKDLNSGVWNRRQNIERGILAPLVTPGDAEDTDRAEPALSTRLCAMIVAYWRARGHAVRAWVETEPGTIGRIYAIRTSGVPVRS